MNAKRRKALLIIVDRLGKLDELRDEIREQLQDVLDEEQEALDNMPESLQNGDRGQRMLEGIDAMQDVIGELDLMFVATLQEQLYELTGAEV